MESGHDLLSRRLGLVWDWTGSPIFSNSLSTTDLKDDASFSSNHPPVSLVHDTVSDPKHRPCEPLISLGTLSPATQTAMPKLKHSGSTYCTVWHPLL